MVTTVRNHTCRFKVPTKAKKGVFAATCDCGRKKSWPADLEPKYNNHDFGREIEEGRKEWYERWQMAMDIAPVPTPKILEEKVLTEDLEME